MTDPVMLLSQLHGEGRVTFHALRAAGFLTLGSVAGVPVQTLADRAHLSSQTARRLKTGAEQMLLKGIGAPAPAEAPLPRAGRTQEARASKPNAAAAAPPAAEFSEGVSLAEASLLGQGIVPTSAEEEIPARPAPVMHEAIPETATRAAHGSSWSFG